MKVEMPKSVIVQKKVTAYSGSFEITYEFGWAKSFKADKTQAYMLQQLTGTNLNLSHDCYSATISVLFSSIKKGD